MGAPRQALATAVTISGLALAGAGAGLWWQGAWAQQQAAKAWKQRAALPPQPVTLPASGPGEDKPKRKARKRAAEPLRPEEVLARLWFPRMNQERYLLAGATDRNLDRGPAWLDETEPPGGPGNCIIAGHRDTHFRFLKDAKLGDEIHIDRGSEVHRYRVRQTFIVDKRDVRMLAPMDRAVLTLVTCYPFYWVGPAPKRFIIRADWIPPEQPASVSAQ